MVERNSRQRPASAMLSGEKLRTEALTLVRAQPGYWTIRALSKHLARRHRLTPSLVRDLLQAGPELRPPAPRSAPPPPRPSAPVSPRPAQTWDRLVEGVTWWLSESETESVHVEVTASGIVGGETLPGDLLPAQGARKAERLLLRYDFVEAGPKSRVWLTGLAPSPELLESYLAANPWTLTPPGRLPLTGARADVIAPALVVWRHATAAAAALSLREVLSATLGVGADQVRIERQQCTPIELERRLNDDATVRRLSGRQGRARIAVSQCDRCGQPLSDPLSVQLGIGPECRKYYSSEVIRRLSRPEDPHPRPGTLKEKQWLVNVTVWLRDATDT